MGDMQTCVNSSDSSLVDTYWHDQYCTKSDYMLNVIICNQDINVFVNFLTSNIVLPLVQTFPYQFSSSFNNYVDDELGWTWTNDIQCQTNHFPNVLLANFSILELRDMLSFSNTRGW